jgi:hypothetical protein
MASDGSNQPELTVGSLLGLPLGGRPRGAQRPASSAKVAPPGRTSAEPRLTDQEAPWTIVQGELRQPQRRTAFRPDGLEALTYDNPFAQDIEQVWFDGKVVYAVDLGQVAIDPAVVKVAQEYQIVYAVDLDEHGKTTSEPERVPGQLNIYDSVPQMEKYSPIWQFNYVVVPREYQANALRSEGDCLTSGYTIRRSQVFEN